MYTRNIHAFVIAPASAPVMHARVCVHIYWNKYICYTCMLNIYIYTYAKYIHEHIYTYIFGNIETSVIAPASAPVIYMCIHI